MGLRDNLRRFLDGRPADQRRNLTLEQAWRMDDELPRPAAGRRVTIDTALTLPVVQRAFALMAGDIGPLPIDTFRRVGGQRVPMEAPAWVDLPDPVNPNWRRPQFIGQCVTSLMDEGNLFIRAFPDRFSPVFIRILDPYRVTIQTDPDGVDWYRYQGVLLSSQEVVHIPGLIVLAGKTRAKSPVVMLKESISTGLAATEFGGRFFSNGSTMGGMVEVPQGSVVDPAKLKKDMERDHRGTSQSWALGVLTGGAHYNEIGTNARDSQMLELMEFIVEEVGRAYGIPPFKLGSTDPGAVAYASTVNARIDYVQGAVQPIVSRIEEALSTLIPGDDTYLRLNLNGLLRGDQEARYAAYHTMLQDSVITKDEVRAWEDWGPADGAIGVETEHGGFLVTPNNSAASPSSIELVQAGLLTENEAREKLGLGPIDWGDAMSSDEITSLIAQVQAGLLTESEARAMLNREPIDWGDTVSKDESDILISQVQAGLLTEAEAREKMGLAPIDWGDAVSQEEIATLIEEVKAGLLTENEARQKLGLEPISWPDSLTKDESDTLISQVQAGLLTEAEARAMMKLPPIDWGDALSAQEITSLIEQVKAGLLTENEARERLGLGPLDWPEDLSEKIAHLDALIKDGFEPSDVLRSLGLAPMAHLGLPPTTLQKLVDAEGLPKPAPLAPQAVPATSNRMAAIRAEIEELRAAR